jgi:hypothetical protein
MEKRIKVFINNNTDYLEETINLFLEKEKGKLHDIKYIITTDCGDYWQYALLIYTPEEKND